MNMNQKNPYVGPRTFLKNEAHLFFGRDREARDLLALVVSEQVVLFYAQSGAGKSSLINTRLIPSLESKNYQVFRVGRVSGDAPPRMEVGNIYAFNLMRSLLQREINPEILARLSLDKFLGRLNTDQDGYFYDDTLLKSRGATPRRRVLIIDQFEELFNTHPEAWEKRADFFSQLAQTMEADLQLWVVLVMREDYIAALDPYAHLLPGQLRARYYMRRMGIQAALDAIRRPVEKDRPYEPGVPELLVDNMRLISNAKVPGHVDQPVYGEFIEPVQLQVVCYQLWERIEQRRDVTTSKQSITKSDIKSIAGGENITQFISNALADFYEQAIAKVLGVPEVKVKERDLRDWFTYKLITEAETRGFIYRGTETTAGLPNSAVDILASQFIIRPESRAGGVWIELVHDRFVGPILQANRKWAQKSQKSLRSDAVAWKEAGKPDSKLYDGKLLEFSLTELEARPEAFTNIEKEFIRAGQRATVRRRQWFWLALGTATFIVFLVLAGLLISNIKTSRQYQELAGTSAANAATEAANAAIAKTEADYAKKYSDIAQTASFKGIEVAFTATYVETLQAMITTQDVQIATLQAVAFPNLTPTLAEATRTPIPLSERVIGYSAGNNEIRVFSFGNGPRHAVMVGGLHAGFAPSTVIIAQALKEYLTNNPNLIPANITVDLITIANPDSLPPPNRDFSGDINGRLNANQVDLNRNWGCDWKPDAVWRNIPVSGGATPFSEPETIALKTFITAQKLTAAVVFWEARSIPPSVSPGGCGNSSIYSGPLSRLYADASSYTAQDFVAYAINGDATNWLDSQGIGAITVLLPSYTELSPDDFNANVNAIKQMLQFYGR